MENFKRFNGVIKGFLVVLKMTARKLSVKKGLVALILAL